YRNLKSKVGVRDRYQFEGNVQKWLEAYIAIENFLGDRLKANYSFCVAQDEEPARTASRLRSDLGLDDDEPLISVIELLERFGIRTIGIDTDLAIDGLAARFGNEHVVVLNSNVSN